MVGVRPDGNTPWGDSWAVAWRALLASRVVVLVAGALAAGLLGLDPRHTGFDPAGITTPYGGLGDAQFSQLHQHESPYDLEPALVFRERHLSRRTSTPGCARAMPAPANPE